MSSERNHHLREAIEALRANDGIGSREEAVATIETLLGEGDFEQRFLYTPAGVAALLKTHFPGLGTDEEMGGGDTVEALCRLYGHLRRGGGHNFDDPVSCAVDAFLADGGTASELLARVAAAVAYAGPQTRPEETDHGGEYDETAEELGALSAKMRHVYG